MVPFTTLGFVASDTVAEICVDAGEWFAAVDTLSPWDDEVFGEFLEEGFFPEWEVGEGAANFVGDFDRPVVVGGIFNSVHEYYHPVEHPKLAVVSEDDEFVSFLDFVKGPVEMSAEPFVNSETGFVLGTDNLVGFCYVRDDQSTAAFANYEFGGLLGVESATEPDSVGEGDDGRFAGLPVDGFEDEVRLSHEVGVVANRLKLAGVANKE